MNKDKPAIRPILLAAIFVFLAIGFCHGQETDTLEFSLDVNSPTVVLPQIFKPNIDLSGKGFHREASWPQTLAAKEVLDTFTADLGLNNFYRLQYNLWEIQQLSKDKPAQEKLLNNYEEIIKKISDNGGTVILNLSGTPYGLGRVLDKNSAPHNLKEYKELIKKNIRYFSCEKKYNVWYEVWNAPDIGDFFIGERSEYLNLYRVAAEAVNELRQETKMQIPLGGPSVSAWFKNAYANNILFPERSLIYELIKYCYSYRLPLDFISWHAYSSDPKEEDQQTIYNKQPVQLIRDWLSYFHFDDKTPLIIDEWNFDGSANVSAARGKDSNVSASYIPARLKFMYESGIDNQTYFCLEDFGGSKNIIARNLGIASAAHTKASYNIFRMLGALGKDLYINKFTSEFIGVIPTKSQDYLAVLIYNYIDPRIALNFISRNIASLNSAERKSILNIIKSDRIKKILALQLEIASLKVSPKVKELLKNAVELNNLANKNLTLNRSLNISIKGLKEIYVLSKYVVDNNCTRNCPFKPVSESDVDFNSGYAEKIDLAPYSVQLLVFKKKPQMETETATLSQNAEIK